MKKIITVFLLMGLSLFAVSSNAITANELKKVKELKGITASELYNNCKQHLTLSYNVNVSDSAFCAGYILGVIDVVLESPGIRNCFKKEYPNFNYTQFMFDTIQYIKNNPNLKGIGAAVVLQHLDKYYPFNDCYKKAYG